MRSGILTHCSNTKTFLWNHCSTSKMKKPSCWPHAEFVNMFPLLVRSAVLLLLLLVILLLLLVPVWCLSVDWPTTASASRFRNRNPKGIVMFDLYYQSRPPTLVFDLPAFMYGRLSPRTDIKRINFLQCCCCGGAGCCCCWYSEGLMQLFAAHRTKIVSWCVWQASYHGNNVTFLWRLKLTFSYDSVGDGCSCWCWEREGERSEMCCHVTCCSCFTWFGTMMAVWSLKEIHVSGKRTESLWWGLIPLKT